MSTNIWTFSGNLGRDAELKSTPQGHTLLEFNVAVTSGWGDRKQTTWVRCELWNKRAEALHPHLPKGQRVIVSGEATNREYEKKDGTKGRSLEVRVSEIEIVGDRQSPPKQQGFRETEPTTTPAPDSHQSGDAGPAKDFDDSEIPF